MRHKLVAYPVLFIVLIALLAPSGGFGHDAVRAAGSVQARPVVRYATRTDTSKPLRQIPPIPPVLGEIFTARPAKHLPNREGSAAPTTGVDPVVQTSIAASIATVSASFEGVGNVDGVLPPDTNGDIGPNHYVQMVNLSFAIFDRSGHMEYGPTKINTLWQGFGGPCESTNNGDPIVLYDHLADRWMMSQFALPRFPRGPFYQCIAVSQTPDPIGAWYRYQFLISNDKLNDYPKFGLWPDGYYMSINQFKCNYFFCNWAGAGAVAFERDQMLIGGPARMVYFDLYNTDPNLGGMLPADLDGPISPSGSPNPFAQFDDDAWGYSSDQLQLWNFHVDWSNTASSTFSFDRALTTADFDSNMCGGSRNCIPQPGGTNVDAIADRLMYRLQYRNFGGYQTLVVNHTVDVDSSDHAGIRWYELRDSGSGWTINQQGTFAPSDGDHRWMGSAAMNKAGDIALGYSVSSDITYPSISFTGRLGTDTILGSMTQGEGTIVDGIGYQQHSAGRWGDYSMLAVDPTDDCTFWYTQEYYAVMGIAPWQTRIGSFRLSDCGVPTDNPPTVNIINPADGSTVTGSVTIQISANDAEDPAGTLAVSWNLDGGAWHTATYNGGTGYYEGSWDTTAEADGNRTLAARAIDGGTNTATASNMVVVDNINNPPNASFTYTCTGLTCNFDASASSDADGIITGFAWDFGDNSSGGGDTITHTYIAGGDYPVTLTVTDDGGETGTQTQTVTVVQKTGTHVGDLDGTSTNEGKTWTAIVTVTVHDPNEGLVANATVSGTWTGGASGIDICTTDSFGTCELQIGGILKKNGFVNFSVDDITGVSPGYYPADNHDPDSDSNGTSITVSK